MERKYLIEYVSVTEAAAAAAAVLVGMGRKDDADALAVGAMRKAFDRIAARGRVVIGEGEMDEAPMLFIGEQVGPDDPSLPMFDIAVDPLEGTNLCAKDQPGAITTLAVAEEGKLLAAPDMSWTSWPPVGRRWSSRSLATRERGRPRQDSDARWRTSGSSSSIDPVATSSRRSGTRGRGCLSSATERGPAVRRAAQHWLHMMMGRGGARRCSRQPP